MIFCIPSSFYYFFSSFIKASPSFKPRNILAREAASTVAFIVASCHKLGDLRSRSRRRPHALPTQASAGALIARPERTGADNASLPAVTLAQVTNLSARTVLNTHKHCQHSVPLARVNRERSASLNLPIRRHCLSPPRLCSLVQKAFLFNRVFFANLFKGRHCHTVLSIAFVNNSAAF